MEKYKAFTDTEAAVLKGMKFRYSEGDIDMHKLYPEASKRGTHAGTPEGIIYFIDVKNPRECTNLGVIMYKKENGLYRMGYHGVHHEPSPDGIEVRYDDRYYTSTAGESLGGFIRRHVDPVDLMPENIYG